MVKSPVRTKWDTSGFDDIPTIDNYRTRFNRRFSGSYLEKATRMLDIGCGIGSYTYVIDREGCVGIDVQMEAVRTAKKYCMKSDFAVASALNLPFRDGTFDLAFVWGVLEQLDFGTESEAITEVHRILRSAGTFLVSAANNHFFTKVFDPGFLFRGQRHYEGKKIIDLILQTGFSVEQHTIRGGIATLITNDLILFYKHVLHKKGGRILSYFNRKSEKEFNSTKNGIVVTLIAAKKK
jgi:SAM-dependent methyltransferase